MGGVSTYITGATTMTKEFKAGDKVRLTTTLLLHSNKKTRKEFSGVLTIKSIQGGVVCLKNCQGHTITLNNTRRIYKPPR